jgi:hypothetical protein
MDPDIPFNETSAAEIAEKGYADEDEYHRALAEQLKCLACSGDADTVYIVRGVIANNRVQVTGAEAPGLVEAILKPACPVSATLTEADKAALNKIKIAKAAH